MAAVKAQIDGFSNTCHQIVPYESYVGLTERLNSAVPGDFAKKTISATTGTEAVENAIKIARAYTGLQGVVAFACGFHGRTFVGMAMTGKASPTRHVSARCGAMSGTSPSRWRPTASTPSAALRPS